MIRILSASRRDKEKLKSLRVDSGMPRKEFSHYAGLVIKKPWGYEYLVLENEKVAVWVLHIQHGFQTSLHCHPNKVSSLTVLDGEALCSTLTNKMIVRPGEGLLIKKGVFHTTYARSPNGVIVMETETPNNKHDLVRLNDKYGREGKGYEGRESHISPDTLDYMNLKSFHEPEERYYEPKQIGRCVLTLVKHSNPATFRNFLRNADANLVSVVRGCIYNSRQPVVGLGEIAGLSHLKMNRNLSIVGEVELLLVKSL